ncbi:MAG: ImmA/IrrE family metallo-endopeptidase [Pyrinomonadaceae bacterium]
MEINALPKNEKARRYELFALGLREFAGLKSDERRLEPETLARFAGLLVVSFEQIAPSLSSEARERLTGAGKNDWSGGACSQVLPNGKKLIILNPQHSKTRQKATLMEEISHVFMGHKPSRLAVATKSKDGILRARDYHAEIEEEAYTIGTAALVPYSALLRFVQVGRTAGEIARHFDVSRALVEFRMKICGIWANYLEIQGIKITI